MDLAVQHLQLSAGLQDGIIVPLRLRKHGGVVRLGLLWRGRGQPLPREQRRQHALVPLQVLLDATDATQDLVLDPEQGLHAIQPPLRGLLVLQSLGSPPLLAQDRGLELGVALGYLWELAHVLATEAARAAGGELGLGHLDVGLGLPHRLVGMPDVGLEADDLRVHRLAAAPLGLGQLLELCPRAAPSREVLSLTQAFLKVRSGARFERCLPLNAGALDAQVVLPALDLGQVGLQRGAVGPCVLHLGHRVPCAGQLLDQGRLSLLGRG